MKECIFDLIAQFAGNQNNSFIHSPTQPRANIMCRLLPVCYPKF